MYHGEITLASSFAALLHRRLLLVWKALFGGGHAAAAAQRIVGMDVQRRKNDAVATRRVALAWRGRNCSNLLSTIHLACLAGL